MYAKFFINVNTADSTSNGLAVHRTPATDFMDVNHDCHLKDMNKQSPSTTSHHRRTTTSRISSRLHTNNYSHQQSSWLDAAGILACFWWAAQSVALVLANKAVFSQPLFDYPWLILMIQSTVVVMACSIISFVRRDPNPLTNISNITNMVVPSCLFLLYHYSNARSLRFISLPAFTVVKSLAPLGVTTIERFTFLNVNNSIQHTSSVYLSLVMSLLANLITFDSASSISQTSMLGYGWCLFNVTTHIFYVLSLRYCTGEYKATDKAFIANFLSIPAAFMLAVLNQEIGTFSHEVALLPLNSRIPLVFCFALSAGCLVSVLSAFEAASSDALRYLAQTNKIAIVSLGAVIFRTKLTPHAWFGVVLSLLSGFLFVYAKSKSSQMDSALGIARPIVSSPTLELLLPTEMNTNINTNINTNNSSSNNGVNEIGSSSSGGGSSGFSGKIIPSSSKDTFDDVEIEVNTEVDVKVKLEPEILI